METVVHLLNRILLSVNYFSHLWIQYSLTEHNLVLNLASESR